MKKGLAKLTVCLGALLLLCVSHSWAQHQKTVNEIMKELKLSPEQERQIREHRDASEKKIQELERLLQEMRSKLKIELEKQASDRVKVERLANDIKKIQGHVFDYSIDSIMHMKDILTPEQYQIFQKKIESLR